MTALGLRARSTHGLVGAASALKMAYAGFNKGLTALAAAMALAATRAGAANALRDELAYSQPQLLAHIGRSLPDMYPKAHRWEFEMREVAAFAGASSTAQIFEGIADVYLQLANDWKSRASRYESNRRLPRVVKRAQSIRTRQAVRPQNCTAGTAYSNRAPAGTARASTACRSRTKTACPCTTRNSWWTIACLEDAMMFGSAAVEESAGSATYPAAFLDSQFPQTCS